MQAAITAVGTVVGTATITVVGTAAITVVGTAMGKAEMAAAECVF